MNGIPEAELVSPAPRVSRRVPVWAWLIGGIGLMVAAVITVAVFWISYIGVYGPETWVYTGNQVPKRFVKTMKDVGALDEDESILYFYSDALTDICDGFYFVSNKKVAVYTKLAGDDPLTVVSFTEIEDITLDRDESFFSDSQITIYLKDGQPISFPVSSDYDRDEAFFEAISNAVPELEANVDEAESDELDEVRSSHFRSIDVDDVTLVAGLG